MHITDEEKENIVIFLNAVNEMIAGRFILSDTKVSNILKAIVKSETLYDLYTNCMSDFSFANTMEMCSVANPNNGGYFVMPDTDKSVVAFVTCLLLEVDKKHINLQTFVTDNFFSADGYNISYNNFALTVLVVYKNSVKNLLNIDDDANSLVDDSEDVLENQISLIDEGEESDNEVKQDTKMLFASLVMNINELQDAINEEYKIKRNDKEELLIVLKALQKAIYLEELLIINALLVPLEHSLLKFKKLKPIYENIKLLIADIYY